jgi:hypothetical protein
MELRHLRYFVAVAELRSVRAASEQLHVTQPAISRQIQDLEETIGAALFERAPRGLVLTAAGEAWQKRARFWPVSTPPIASPARSPPACMGSYASVSSKTRHGTA